MVYETRRLRYDNPDSWKIYKFTSEEELVNAKIDLDTHYKRSVQIIDYGNITENHLSTFDKMHDDYAYMDLHLKAGDLFLFTKEITNLKLEDERKAKKIAKTNVLKSAPIEKLHKVLPKLRGEWSDEHLEKLWIGTKEVVAKIVNKSPMLVQKRRIEYLQDHPDFTYPEECKTPRKNASKKEKKTNTEWTQAELQLLWTLSGKQLGKILHRTIFDVSNKRTEFCKQNPNFVIPYSSEFKKGDLPNEVEYKRKKKTIEVNTTASNVSVETRESDYFWSDKEKEALWQHSAGDIIKLFPKRTYHAIYMARTSFLKKNPKFVIPLAACFKPPKKYENKIETEAISPSVNKEAKSEVIQEKKSSNVDFFMQLVSKLKPKKFNVLTGDMEF